jgi:hypothetical protein
MCQTPRQCWYLVVIPSGFCEESAFFYAVNKISATKALGMTSILRNHRRLFLLRNLRMHHGHIDFQRFGHDLLQARFWQHARLRK